jgi:hypothetical protein
LIDDRTHANLPKASPWICITNATHLPMTGAHLTTGDADSGPAVPRRTYATAADGSGPSASSVFGLLALEIEAHDSWAAFARVHRAHLSLLCFR